MKNLQCQSQFLRDLFCEFQPFSLLWENHMQNLTLFSHYRWNTLLCPVDKIPWGQWNGNCSLTGACLLHSAHHHWRTIHKQQLVQAGMLHGGNLNLTLGSNPSSPSPHQAQQSLRHKSTSRTKPNACCWETLMVWIVCYTAFLQQLLPVTESRFHPISSPLWKD